MIIPCYNHAHFVGQAIASALSQTCSSVEIIVIDDGSTDNSADVAASFGADIRLLRQPNQGLSAARNTGILAAQGELIQLLDSDDLLRVDALEHAAAAASRGPDVAVFAGSWDEIDSDGHVLGHVRASAFPADTFHTMFDPIAVGPPCRYLVRRTTFARVGLFDPSLRSCEDWDMWLRIAAAGLPFVAVPEACAQYRNSPSSMSKNFGRMWQSGNTVLSRAQRSHAHCARCRSARRRGIRRWRQWCYHSMLVPQLHELREHRDYFTAAGVALSAVARDPRLATLVSASAREFLLGSALK